MRIYVGNLNYDTTEEALHELFSQYGQVEEVAIITDRDTGRPRGFAFVTMPDDREGHAAIQATHGAQVDGRTLNVNEARPRGGNEGGGGGRRGGGGYGGGGQRGRW